MFSAVEIILSKVSKNREKNRRHANGGIASVDSSDTGTARRRRRQEEMKPTEESSDGEGNSDESSSEDGCSRESSDSSSRVRKRKETKKAEIDRKKKPDGRSERKNSTASSKSRTSKSGRDGKISGSIDRSSITDEGPQQEPEARMSRRCKSEELLNASDEETPKLTQSSRAISSLTLKDDQERKVKQKQIFMELRRKQEKERKDQLAEQRRMKQQREQQEIMDKISTARSTEERLNQASEINQTQFRSTSQEFAQREPPNNSKKLHEKEWKETSLDSESSEGHSKKRLPVVPPKPRKKPNDNQSSDSLNDYSSRENIFDNISSLQQSNESIQRPPQTSGAIRNTPSKSIQSRLQTNQGGFSNTTSSSDKLSSVVGHEAGKASSTGHPFSETRGKYYSSSMPRTQHKGQSLVLPRPYKPPQNTGGSSSKGWNTVKMGYQSDQANRNSGVVGYQSEQAKRNSGVVYQVPNHGPAIFPYNGALRGSPTPSNQSIGDFRRNEVSRTINYGHLTQQRADLV